MDELQEFTDAQLHFRPSAGAWNMLQVVQHLQKVEAVVVEQIFRHNTSEPKSLMRFSDHYQAHLLLMALYLPIKYKVPDIRVMPDEMLCRTVFAEWEHQQKQWLGDQRLHPSCKSQIVFIHPRAGGLNCKATFNFLRAHLNHHLIQINTIKFNKNFPGKQHCQSR